MYQWTIDDQPMSVYKFVTNPDSECRIYYCNDYTVSLSCRDRERYNDSYFVSVKYTQEDRDYFTDTIVYHLEIDLETKTIVCYEEHDFYDCCFTNPWEDVVEQFFVS